jgi:hypothetical protein
VYVLNSSMAPLDFTMEPPFDCVDDHFEDIAFVRATSPISGRDAVDEYLACGMFPLLTSFIFG